MNKLLNRIKDNKEYLYILLISIIVCIPLINKNINIYRDDGIQHVCRLIGTYQTIRSGEILPMIMLNLCNNFGYSWNIFYSPLTAYAPLIFKIFNFTFTNCLKIFMFAVTLLSGIAMYKFMMNVTKNKNVSLLSSILYVLAPYRITDMYIRIAVAELASFMFIPIIFDGLYSILKEEKISFKLIWGTVGLILTHTVITMYMAIICLLYLILNIKKLKSVKVVRALVISIVCILLITSFYWVGLLQHHNATSYEVFVPGRMEVGNKLEYYKTEFYQLFYTSKDQQMIYAIGMVTVLGLVLTPIVWKRIEKEYKRTYVLFLVFGIILTIMTLTFFPFEKLPSVFKMIQFTFRLYEFTAFFFAFVAGINYGIIIKNFKIFDVIVLAVISTLLLIPYNSKLEYELSTNEERLIEGVRVTENTGRVHAGMASMEYLPSKAFKVLNTYIANRKDEPIIMSGEAEILNYNKNGTNLEFELKNEQEADNQNNKTEAGLTIELPYIYYLGYRVYANGSEIEYTESDNGFVQIKINPALYEQDVKINVKYTGTNEMFVTFKISVIFIFAIEIFELLCYIKKKQKRRKRKMKEKTKNERKGITLIALVVTIVVLLILAGVSINLVLGNNGIVAKAEKASVETEISQIAEKINFLNYEISIDSKINGQDESVLAYLKNNGMIDENNVLNTKKLLGAETRYGNGIESDVYKIQGNKIVYINKESKKVAERDVDAQLLAFVTEWTVNDNDTIVLPISYKYEGDNDFFVNWGDGSAVENIKGVLDQAPSHTYSKAGKYHISITGICSYFDLSSITEQYPEVPQKLTKLVSWGEIEARRYGFTNAVNLAGEIPSPAKNSFKHIKDFSYLFYHCQSIETIPADLFKNIPEQVQDFNGAFNRCEKLKYIPNGLFDEANNATNFRKCFSSCSSLTQIPENLFKNNTQVTTFENTFYKCTGLTGIPENLFKNNKQVTTFENTFRECTSLTSIPVNLFNNNQKASNFKYTFADSDKLVSVPKLWERTVSGLDGTGCFYGCEKINRTGITPDIITKWFETGVQKSL